MRFISTITLFSCVLACNTQTPPTDAGPAPDVTEQDAHIPDAGNDSGPWTSEWLEEPLMETVDMSPCEDWEAMPRMERQLPADSTPRVLWYNFPPRDPGYVGLESQYISILDSPTLAPDGTIWTIGPGLGQISHIDRAGALIQTYRVTGRYEQGGLGPLVVAPDGSVLVAATGTDLDGTVILGAVLHIVPLVRAHPGEHTPPDTGISFPFGDRGRPRIAVGPGGMVYISFDGEITATCRGERVMWRLKQASARPDITNRRFVLMRIRPNGDFVASFAAQRIYVVAPDGSLTFEYDSNLARSWNQSIGPATSTARTIQLYDPTAEPASRLLIYRDGTTADAALPVKLTPSDDLWYVEEAPRQPVPIRLFRRSPPDYAESMEFPWSSGLGTPMWLPDGGRLTWGADPDDEEPIRRTKRLARLSRDGEVAWDINVVEEGLAIEPLSFTNTNWVMDDSGVLYIRSFFRSDSAWALLAIQTDSLPPGRDTCLFYPGQLAAPSCNAQRDHWLRAE